MIVFRRRLIFWLIKAYIKKSGKTILFSFLFGLAIFFVLVFSYQYLGKLIPVYKKTTIGLVGAYTENNLPPVILDKLSIGLTSVDQYGNIKPALASSWKILDGGKTYIFNLKPNQYFNDGKEVSSDTVSYNFSDVSEEKLSKYTIEFKLKEAYSPFLATVSQPVFENGLNGVGKYAIQNIELNGDFVQDMTLEMVKNHLDTVQYEFYPTEDSLKLAFLLGDISEAEDLSSADYKTVNFSTFPHTTVVQATDYSSLVTLFYNTQDQHLSDQHIRLALSYAIPDSFAQGVKAYGPYSPYSIYYDKDLESNTQDYVQARLLLAESNNGKVPTKLPNLTITTLTKYYPAAEVVASAWKKLGFNTTIVETDTIPSQFQIFLGDFSIPKDPDQYIIWHSQQEDNITQYKSIRIDKLLEEGRNTVGYNQRQQIYYDFQKYLMDDQPASFLYFPYMFTVSRS